jgi:hypothetical protein
MRASTQKDSADQAPHGSGRRQFLKTSLGLAGFALAGGLAGTPRALAASSRPAGANARLGGALIGCGSRGRAILRECVRNREEWQLEFPAVCDVWQTALANTAQLLASATGRHPKTLTHYQEMLAMEEIDCVIIATPDFSHTPILIAAAEAGKQVYVEKPMAVSIDQANAAREAALRHHAIVQAGTQFRSVAHLAEERFLSETR